MTLRTILADVVEQGVRVVSNAGGAHPLACADAIATLAAEQGLAVKVAVVLGDDVMPLLPRLRTESVAGLPEQVASANADLGAPDQGSAGVGFDAARKALRTAAAARRAKRCRS